ncbi:mediator of RNA polymerase II transcription subunit 4-like [Physella acuta]|uniref:mediator of RNA polymerase II transcription subunit 4-like n=1 Tax=Physella acuta TaxID=109671 RepID=UPI0027DD6718|nr:mediator of RNA polymerase II transcription subunit 4-like [Physella acuta]
MASEPSTRQKLHSIIDDMELISKELIEQLAMPKSQRKSDVPDATDLMELLIEKDGELKELLKIAQEQEKVEKVIDSLKVEVGKRDGEIRQLQRVLKEAETIMATAVYQAKQKLAAVRQAQQNKISSEDLIKYAHRISASNAVAAPPTWSPGDPRRPYPTDLEMRHSCLSMGSFPDTTTLNPVMRMYSQESQASSHHQTTQPSLGHHQQSSQQAGMSHHQQPSQQSGLSHHQHSSQQAGLGHHPQQTHHHQQQGIPPPYSWQPSQDGSLSLNSHHTIADSLKGHSKEEDDVELMSSDSSSSSSSDE